MEQENLHVLQLLAKQYEELPKSFFPIDAISQDCNLDTTKTTEICTFLEEDGLINSYFDDEGSKSFQIGLDGLLFLEGYMTSGSKQSASLLKFKESFKQKSYKANSGDDDLHEEITTIAKKHNLVNGLYYILLVDLSSSTVTASKMSGIDYHVWIKEFIKITKSAVNVGEKNVVIHVKSIGDGSLFLFRNFNDILIWKNKVDELCKRHNYISKHKGKPDFYQYQYKTIIHLGEIYFDSESPDANTLGINVVFKIEKKFGKGEIGITELVKQTILQEIMCGNFSIEPTGNFVLRETVESVIPLWKLTLKEQIFS